MCFLSGLCSVMMLLPLYDYPVHMFRLLSVLILIILWPSETLLQAAGRSLIPQVVHTYQWNKEMCVYVSKNNYLKKQTQKNRLCGVKHDDGFYIKVLANNKQELLTVQ